MWAGAAANRFLVQPRVVCANDQKRHLQLAVDAVVSGDYVVTAMEGTEIIATGIVPPAGKLSRMASRLNRRHVDATLAEACHNRVNEACHNRVNIV